MRKDESMTALVRGVPLWRIAGVIEAEGRGLCGQCPQAALGIAQAMRDMTDSGKFGQDLETVLKQSFLPPVTTVSGAAVNAAIEVFKNGKSRDPDWRIYDIRHFSFFCGKEGLPDISLLREIFGKYDYLGCDGITEKEGIFFFGKARVYSLEVGKYLARSNARLLRDYLKDKSIPARIVEEKGFYKVFAGAFRSESAARAYIPLLEDLALKGAAVVRGELP